MTNCTDLKSPGTWGLAETAGTPGVLAALVDVPRAWDGDDDPNGPAIPRITGIPGPRKEPVPVPTRCPKPREGSLAALRPTAGEGGVFLPRPRLPEPAPRQPIRDTFAAVLTCCGRKLRRSGSQLVCDTCGAWTTAVATLLPVVAGQCGTCQGRGGREVDTSSGGVTRKNWRSCTACNGSGVR
ncbi:hypothetical protein ABT358_02225 [Streptomyces sp. NPDC000341]|uniref:hypothetical protein n=1 Tax=Streptomyces sp. NPDC000341 TaxID=3156645 RepID=UPI0033246372